MEVTAELKLVKKRIAIRNMEAAGGGGGGGSGGEGEMRRIHIIYFLSRKGRVEHPHLIRVHHLSRNGIHLRDVKRWLSELRGKDLPDSFAWSYKRRYRTGYVWQDLLDEDLITPISDNEYVLKGSEISSFNLDLYNSQGEKKVSMENKGPTLQTNAKEEIQESPAKTATDASSAKPSPPLGSEASTMTEDSTKLEDEKLSDINKQETPPKTDKTLPKASKYEKSFLLGKRNAKKKNRNNINVESNPSTPATSSTSSSSASFTKSKSYSSGASNMLLNLIKCGGVDTTESTVMVINRPEKRSSYMPLKKPPEVDTSVTNTAEICKGDGLGGSERIYGTYWNKQLHFNSRRSFDGWKSSNNEKSEANGQKPVSAVYKPVNRPSCSVGKCSSQRNCMHT
ncbi:protein SOSEKI 1 isoform X2 [Diospyros lotus]|uniref:protein SOSEKI 1 isoform X2 n=1 Tax=Diospyros lotus TaxID=55363 RepID=UPI00225B4E97|nr:protein SOSEKI 1 isoform X2 [Diospyros lotus]